MWRARLTLYAIVVAIAVTSSWLHSLPDPNVRSIIGMAMNLAALPVIEVILRFLRREAVESALSALRDPKVRAAQRSNPPQAPDPLH